MPQVRLAVILAACALGASSSLVAAAPKSAAERAKVLQQVVDCRKITDAGERLACYDSSAQALDDAEKTGQVVVVDQAKAREIRRQSFGFALPSLSVLNLAGNGDGVDRLETTIESAPGGRRPASHAEGRAAFRGHPGCAGLVFLSRRQPARLSLQARDLTWPTSAP